MPLLKLDGLCFSYNTNEILKDLYLTLDTGEAVLLLGPNGCGKTTLLDCLIGYKRQTHGSIMIDSKDIDRFSPRERAQRLAYVPQTSQGIFPYTALEMVLMGRTPYIKNAASPSKQDNIIAIESLESLGMGSFKDRMFTSLSGGEQQLVLIARALAQNTDIIMLDEPTASLDIKNETAVLARICSMAHNTNKAFIIATHQPNHAFYLAQKGMNVTAALFEDKTIKYIGSPTEVLNENTINRVYNVCCDIIEYGSSRKTIIVD